MKLMFCKQVLGFATGWFILLASGPAGAADLAPFTPKADLAGPWAMNLNTNRPNVLILGDSISIGYTRPVRQLLSGQANGAENCGDHHQSGLLKRY